MSYVCLAIANFTVALNQVLRWSTDSICIHCLCSVYIVYVLCEGWSSLEAIVYRNYISKLLICSVSLYIETPVLCTLYTNIMHVGSYLICICVM